METTNIQDGCSDIWQWRHNPHIGDRNTAHLREIYGNKCDTLTIDEDLTRDLLAHMKTRLPPEANVEIQATISMEEMEMAIRQGKSAKAPGHVGIRHDFLKRKLKTIGHDLLQIVNDMYVGKAILDSQKHGIFVCVPKKRQPERPEGYRALTLLQNPLSPTRQKIKKMDKRLNPPQTTLRNSWQQHIWSPRSDTWNDCPRGNSGVPRNFFRGGGGVQQIQLRTEDRENRDMEAVAP